ncbi:MAG: c-type cytochrome [Deltaproteobacteria bacterium]|nr:c-type cytochrome [Deltaproteobacteria bacterium]
MNVSKLGRWTVSLGLAGFIVGCLWNISYADGKGIFASKNCGSCHQIQGPATEKTFDDQLKKKGPELWYAGSKFKKEWLEEWLEKPTTIRLLKYNSVTEKNTEKHPALSKKEAEEVAGYLMTLTAKEASAAGIKEAVTPQGKNLFMKRYGCVGCHSIKAGARKVGGVSGPDLSDAGKRLKGDWVYAYLKEPKVFKPVKRMPVFVGIINDNEMKMLAGFVAGQK